MKHLGFRVTAKRHPMDGKFSDMFEVKDAAREHARRLFASGWHEVQCQEVRLGPPNPDRWAEAPPEAETLIDIEFHVHELGLAA